MDKKIVIYGLGRGYKEFQTQIEQLPGEHYYCDRDETKIIGVKNGITLPYLKEHLDDFDEIIVTLGGDILMVGDAMLEIGAKPEKYRIMMQITENNDLSAFHYHGEECVDAMAEAALRAIGKNPRGIRYIEIGSSHPIGGNNSYHFYQRGGSGILVDPLIESEIVSKACRPGDKFLRYAVVGERKTKEIEFYVNTDIASGISSIHADHYKRWGGDAPKKITVECIAINELLDEAGFIPDILFIDAEGEDENILRALDISDYPIPIILVEICDLSDERYCNIVEYMKDNGYICYTTTPRRVNAVFARSDMLLEGIEQ